jgi:hypothetical protein
VVSVTALDIPIAVTALMLRQSNEKRQHNGYFLGIGKSSVIGIVYVRIGKL